LKVAEYLRHRLESFRVQTSLIDLNKQRLPLYDDSDTGNWQDVWRPIGQELDKVEGYVFVAPEWNGTMGPGLPNMLLYVGREMAHKPVMTVGVSAGRGGTYPLVDMRLMGYKNNHYIITPESLIFGKVKETLVDGQVTDERQRARADYALKILMEYATALTLVRHSGTVDFKTFPNGV
jgi:NAD(P)H-dependent FMN reductase